MWLQDHSEGVISIVSTIHIDEFVQQSPVLQLCRPQDGADCVIVNSTVTELSERC